LPYFSLEFIEGGSLDKKLGNTPRAPKQSAQIVETLARAMQAAHEAGVIHRDLKRNVLVGRLGAEDHRLRSGQKLDERRGRRAGRSWDPLVQIINGSGFISLFRIVNRVSTFSVLILSATPNKERSCKDGGRGRRFSPRHGPLRQRSSLFITE